MKAQSIRSIARLLGTDVAGLHHYIFETRRSTFIRTHGPSLRITRLHDDLRFGRDYVPLFESVHPPSPAAWKALWSDAKATPPWRGDDVRRDALALVPLETLRTRYRDAGIDQWEPESRPRDSFLRSPSLTLWAWQRLT